MNELGRLAPVRWSRSKEKSFKSAFEDAFWIIATECWKKQTLTPPADDPYPKITFHWKDRICPFKDNAGNWSHTKNIIFIFYCSEMRRQTSESRNWGKINKFLVFLPSSRLNLLRLPLGTSRDNKNYGQTFNPGGDSRRTRWLQFRCRHDADKCHVERTVIFPESINRKVS